jgi:hypothetical protein
MLVSVLAAVVLGTPAVQQIDTVLPVGDRARLRVHAVSAEVTVRTWNRSEVRIVAERQGRRELDVRGSRSTIQVESMTPFGTDNRIEITAPATLDLEIEGAFVSADIEGVRAEVRVVSAHGDLRLVGGDGLIQLQAVQGNVECRGARGRIEVGTTNGQLSVIDVDGTVVAETVNGTVTLTGIASDAVEASSVNGDITYRGTLRDGGRYVLGAHNGNVSVAVPTGTNADVLVSQFSGEFESDFPITLTGTRSPGKRFTFTIGNGGARIELSSFGGTIRLRRP